jgi:hypothetical protein
MPTREKRVMFAIETNGDHVVTIRANRRQRRFVAVVIGLVVLHVFGYAGEKGVALVKWMLSLVP